MSLYKKIYTDNLKCVIWKITEDLDFLQKTTNISYLSLKKLKSFKSDKRKREFLATRKCFEVLEIDDKEVTYNQNNKPFIKNNHISISHSYNFVVVALSKKEIGVDIEKKNEKILKIQNRILNTNEKCAINNLESLHIIWGVKESLYKIQDIKGVDFKNNFIVNINEKSCLINSLKKSYSFENYLFENYCLVLVY